MRPTSTSRQEDALISASPIVIESAPDLLVDRVSLYFASVADSLGEFVELSLALKFGLATKIPSWWDQRRGT